MFRRTLSRRNSARSSLLGVPAVALTLTIGLAAPAGAHVSVQLYGATATSGGYGVMFLRVPHGCDGDATNAITVTIPAGINADAVKPQQKAGWTITRSGNTITWSGGHLADNEFDDFGLNLRYPTLNAGEASRTVAFPTVQVCDPEVTVRRSGEVVNASASLPSLAGQEVGVFAGDTRLGTATVAADGAVTYRTTTEKAPAGTPITIHRGGHTLANSNRGIEAWTQVTGDGSDMKMPAPTVRIMAATSSGHGH